MLTHASRRFRNSQPISHPKIIATIAIAIITIASGWQYWRESPLSEDQHLTLAGHVCLIARQDKVNPQAVWSRLKQPFGVASYKDFRRKHWAEASDWTLSRLRDRH